MQFVLTLSLWRVKCESQRWKSFERRKKEKMNLAIAIALVLIFGFWWLYTPVVYRWRLMDVSILIKYRNKFYQKQLHILNNRECKMSETSHFHFYRNSSVNALKATPVLQGFLVAPRWIFYYTIHVTLKYHQRQINRVTMFYTRLISSRRCITDGNNEKLTSIDVCPNYVFLPM